MPAMQEAVPATDGGARGNSCARPLKLFIDYPVSNSGAFVGLAVPQVLHDYFGTRSDVEVVSSEQEFDVMLVTNGASQYVGRNPPFEDCLGPRDRLLQRLGLRRFMSLEARYGRFMQRNVYYEQRITELLQRRPHAKVVLRMDGRYRKFCKPYGFDDTVAWLAQRADALVFQTRYNISLYDGEYRTLFGLESPITGKRSEIIYNGVDRSVFHENGERENWPGKIKILHASASAMTRKGLGFLLEVAYALRDNPDVRFYLVGRQDQDPVHGQAITEFNNIRHLPFTDDRRTLARYYRSADILLYPTLDDCSPNVVLEAMSCGLPVAALDSGGTPELIIKDDVKGGLLMHPLNPVYSIKVLVENLPFFRQSAIDLVRRYHTSEIMGARYLDLFRSLVLGRQGASPVADAASPS